MSNRKTLLAASIIAGLCLSGSVYAADTTPAQPGPAASGQDNAQTTADKNKAKELGTVTVVGIRDSEAESLNLKKAADSHVEVITAEDIGKLPAKNVADTLQRLPGINISSSSASEGGFDENDRVSLRGTNPSMTQTLVNGHTVGTGDWFVLSQVQTVGRSVSYTLLPAEVVSEVVVHKSSEAKLQEGGSAGTVDIITRKPLEFAQPFTAQAAVGGVYSDLPGDTKPQFNGLVNWKSDDNTIGVMAQAFYEKRSLQRDGQEIVGGYNQIAADSAIATAHPDLAGKYYPNLIGQTLFTQTRTRKGGTVDIEWKPLDNLTLNLNSFYSKLEADNFNRNYMLWASQFVPSGAGLQSYTVKGNVLTNASFAPQAGSTTPYGVYDQISRPGASSSSAYTTLDAEWRATDHLTFTGQIGTTQGKGNSDHQDVSELGFGAGAGASWDMRGTGKPTNWAIGGDNTSPSGIIPSAGWIFGDQDIHVKDKEDFYQFDGEWALDSSPINLSTLDFGVRYSDHTRENKTDIGQGPTGDWQNPANYPTSWSNYPSGFNSDLGVTAPGPAWYYSPGALAAFDAKYANRDPVARFNWQNIYKVNEKDTAAYVQANFAGDRWTANVGLRYVYTKEDINYNSSAVSSYTSAGPITGSAFGDYYVNTYNHGYDKFLPSANFKFNITDDVIARFAASQTMTRPDYSALAGSYSLDDLTHTGSGGNPQLKPLISTNFDAGLEWYFAPRGLVSAGVYNMQLSDYINFGTQNIQFKDQQASNTAGHDVFSTYQVSVPTNVNGHVKGVELNYIQPIGDYFGVQTNYTYASGSAEDGKPLQGTSKNTFNVSGYFENQMFNARISYTYRSSFYAGVSRTDTYYQAGIGNLAASFGYNINSWMSLTLDAMNLNNPKLKYYTVNPNYGKQPYAFYVNGRQYYLNLRFKI
ncbi:TonB-dependent receptor [Dyella jiangningensis]|uniref:TonB-dependent receptor n=1 Tax=Dyella jiangningensis TaxID=1379159 RepID=A0A328P6Y8_9GAMM|nr:TonB-dependent receptor [Dyella jiangningensis]RAO76542.1 TonB-dependent receptor [Dyella jiangningensis]